ncbi:Intraflagellar transport protein 52 [Blattella germanica]|nr:Intraflagellar transport protein 52 [Blattella germanica]
MAPAEVSDIHVNIIVYRIILFQDLTADFKEKSNTIVFNASKNEQFKISDNYKTLHRKLKGSWKVLTNKDEITMEMLSGVALFVIPGPREKFTENEFNCMKKYLDSGGNILVLLGEGGEKNFQTNVNFLLEEYGIMINSDCVVRTHYYKYFHPKECLVANGVLNRAIAMASGKYNASSQYDQNDTQALRFVYPYGATLNVAQPAVAALSTGTVAFPLNRPVCALYTHTNSMTGLPGGKMAVLASAHLFADKYIDKEDNDKVFPPSFRELPPPSLELFDLDEAFSSERSRLAQLANKCLSGEESSNDEADLEYFVRECGRVLGIGGGGPMSDLDAKQVLHTVSLRIAEFKKLGHLVE